MWVELSVSWIKVVERRISSRRQNIMFSLMGSLRGSLGLGIEAGFWDSVSTERLMGTKFSRQFGAEFHQTGTEHERMIRHAKEQNGLYYLETDTALQPQQIDDPPQILPDPDPNLQPNQTLDSTHPLQVYSRRKVPPPTSEPVQSSSLELKDVEGLGKDAPAYVENTKLKRDNLKLKDDIQHLGQDKKALELGMVKKTSMAMEDAVRK
ncbi:uncharacterized protein G2W53_041316 [Senna tora]|uniref:Uncharacterized protein n=1 Tax=Senna tora TaxID=362788 RepID=A0A834VZ27_9FABA|nr:uncharacterized protein G2W53_041316 [Senna tora]